MLLVVLLLLSSFQIFGQEQHWTQLKDAQLIRERQQRYEDFIECVYIFSVFRPSERQRNLKITVEETYPKMIEEFRDFLKRRPDSFLAGEVKLIITELYRLSGTVFPEDKYSPFFEYTKFDYNWRNKARPFLRDIIKNHSNKRRFSIVSAELTNEYTAAVALWYLGAWSWEVKPLERLLRDYPTSKFAPSAAKTLIAIKSTRN